MGMPNVKEPLAEMARSFPPLFRSTRLAPLASPVTVPPTVPDAGGVVVPPLLPHAARKRVEAVSAARADSLVFTGRLSNGPKTARYVDASGRGGAGCVQGHSIRVNRLPGGSLPGHDLNNPGGVVVPDPAKPCNDGGLRCRLGERRALGWS